MGTGGVGSTEAVTTAQLLRQRSRQIVSDAQQGKTPVATRAKAQKKQLGINPLHSRIALYFRTLRDQTAFQAFIIGVIFLAGVLVGINTYDVRNEEVTFAISLLDEVVVGIFIAEVSVKLLAEGKAPWRYFQDRWNMFDFCIVTVGFFQFSGGAVAALRLVRLLRVLKLVRALPKLRILVIGLLQSLSSIAYIGLLLMLIFYLYGVIGVTLFSSNDPVSFGSLHMAMITLFRCATLEDWTDVMYTNMFGCAEYGYVGMEELCTDPQPLFVPAVVYFISFTIISAMTVLNLFIGVIMQQLQEAQANLSQEDKDREAEANAGVNKSASVLQRLDMLDALMSDINRELDHFAGRKEAELEEKRQLREQARQEEREKRDREAAQQRDRRMAPGAAALLQGAAQRREALLRRTQQNGPDGMPDLAFPTAMAGKR